jgi:glucokinase
MVTLNYNYYFLAGDIGGTNIRLALYRSNDSKKYYKDPLILKEYLNEEYLGKEHTSGDNNNNNNNANFVHKIIVPFLLECIKLPALRIWKDYPDGVFRVDIMMMTKIIICLAVAGPVDTKENNGTVLTSQRDSYLTGLSGKNILNECKMFEGDWDGVTSGFESSVISKFSSCVNRCVIINDFVAQGYGCLSLDCSKEGEDVLRLNSNSNNNNRSKGKKPILCVGAGTGFGSCYLTPTIKVIIAAAAQQQQHDDKDEEDRNGDNNDHFSSSDDEDEDEDHKVEDTTAKYACFPSEVGQIEWVPNTTVVIAVDATSDNNDQIKLCQYLLEKKKKKCSNSNTSRVAVEDVVSGIGVSNAYECFLELYPDQVNPEVQNEYNHAGDLKGKVIGDNYNKCHICKKVIDTIMMYVCNRFLYVCRICMSSS